MSIMGWRASRELGIERDCTKRRCGFALRRDVAAQARAMCSGMRYFFIPLRAAASSSRKYDSFSPIFCSSPRGVGRYQFGWPIPSGR